MAEDLEVVLGIVSAVLAVLLPYLKNKKSISEEQAQIIFQYSEKALEEALVDYPDDQNLQRMTKTLGKLKEGWYDETVSTEQLKAILTIWDMPVRMRKLKEL